MHGLNGQSISAPRETNHVRIAPVPILKARAGFNSNLVPSFTFH
jgi:hypothetical protein